MIENIIKNKLDIINGKSRWNYEYAIDEDGLIKLKAKSGDYIYMIKIFGNTKELYLYLMGKIDTIENGI